MDDATIERISRAITELEKTHLKFHEQLENLKAQLSQTPTPGQQAKALFDDWFTAWGARYQERYVFAGAKDAAGFKRLLKAMDLTEARERMRRYLADNDPFLVRQKHPVQLFFSQVNRWGAAALVDPADVYTAPPVGCKHTPACKNDVEHTRRCSAERRAVRP